MFDFLKSKIIKILNIYVRRNSFISILIFGVKIQDNRRIHWDFTTIILKKCLLQCVKPWHKVLEVGTGTYAILSIFIAKHRRCDVVACEINEEYVLGAQTTAKLNASPIKLLQSDLFENINNKFDIIFFNSIYIPRETGKKLGIDKLHEWESDWCGGGTGTETIKKFLIDAATHLNEKGEVLLGFNIKYLKENLITKLCGDHGYYIKARCSSFFNPSRVFVLRRRQ